MAAETELPQGMSDLMTVFEKAQSPARRSASISCMGVVVHLFPPKLSKTNEWTMTFTLRDLSVDGSQEVGEGVVVRLFRKKQNDLPKVEKVGDIVLLRRPMLAMYANAPIVNPLTSSIIIVIPKDTIPDTHFKDAYLDGKTLPCLCYPQGVTGANATKAEQQYAIWLHSALKLSDKPRANPPTAKPIAPRRNDSPSAAAEAMAFPQDPKWKALSNVQDWGFYNLVCEVVKVYNHHGNVEIYVTDYTENPLFYPYKTEDLEAENNDDSDQSGEDGDPFNYLSRKTNQTRQWAGPPGKMTLQIKLWPPHDSFAASQVFKGTIWHFRNVNVKYNGGTNYLEGVIHGDRDKPSQVNIRHVDAADERVHRLKSRKNKLLQEANIFQKSKRPANHAPDGAQKTAKNQRTKERKRKRQQREKEMSTPNSQPAQTGEIQAADTSADEKKSKSYNVHIKCINPDQKLLPLQSAIQNPHLINDGPNGPVQLPFINQKFRACIKIIDFDPPNLVDFAQPIPPHTQRRVSLDESAMDFDYNDSHPQSNTQWEWRFQLLVEEAGRDHPPQRMVIIVSGNEAVYLLKLDPTDLRRNSKRLGELTQQLFILWGNTEELKTKGELAIEPEKLSEGEKTDSNEGGITKKRASCLPFECCVQEFGVQWKGEWRRRFKLFGTTIQ